MSEVRNGNQGSEGFEIHPLEVRHGPPGVLARAAKQHEHNCDLTSEAGRTALMATAGKPTYSWRNMPKEVMNAVYWRVHETDPTEDGEGEVTNRYRMVLVLDTGETFATLSPYAIETLSLAVQTYGREPWVPPLAFRATKEQTRNGMDFMLLECLGRPVASTSRRK